MIHMLPSHLEAAEKEENCACVYVRVLSVYFSSLSSVTNIFFTECSSKQRVSNVFSKESINWILEVDKCSGVRVGAKIKPSQSLDISTVRLSFRS